MSIMKHKIEVITKEVQNLIDEDFRGNISWFADEIGVDRAYLSEMLKRDVGINSYKICLGIIIYCEISSLDFRRYIKILN